ncbi:MAG: acyltransferase family protein, partial [Microthrixaceae bacterium]
MAEAREPDGSTDDSAGSLGDTVVGTADDAAAAFFDGTVMTRRPTGPDRLLDLIRSVAIVRVVLWHTWSWAWLTWIPAMPAMFFTTGALLDRSLDRRGWRSTVVQRARRLLIPYWIYAAACWIVMLADGWRPDGVAQVLSWVLPLADPVGSPELPGLWVPLWYLRAYLWFVLAAGVLRFLARRLGAWSVAIAGLVGVGAWVLAERGVEIPFAVGDAAAYAPFVLAGMCYAATRRMPRQPLLWVGAVVTAVAAWWSWQRFGPVDGVVNRSYLLTMLVGTAGLCAVVAARGSVLSASAPLTGWIARLNSRALTIYLWQGFGLVAAQRLVTQRTHDQVLGAVASIVVVAVVIVAAVVLVGGAEDLAAGRRRPGSLTLPRPS